MSLTMTPRERRIMHRRNERNAVAAVRHSIQIRDYKHALNSLAWALEQHAAASCAERDEAEAKIARVQKAIRKK